MIRVVISERVGGVDSGAFERGVTLAGAESARRVRDVIASRGRERIVPFENTGAVPFSYNVARLRSVCKFFNERFVKKTCRSRGGLENILKDGRMSETGGANRKQNVRPL